MFDTQFGIASLVLKEIPYKETAYILIRDSLEPEKLVAECVSFCRAVGAEHIYATGHEVLEKYPLYTSILEMHGTAWVDGEKIQSLFPVTEQTVGRWREIYNERMSAVDNSGTLESRDEKRILESGGAYFVHSCGELLGIGWLEEETLLAVASVRPGAGEMVMHSLMSLVEGASMTLEVASTNEKAIRLYEKLGFIKTREISRWYRVR